MDKRSVLVIEDKNVVGTLIQDILIATGRYDVLHACDGCQGLMKIIGDRNMALPSDKEGLEKKIGEIASSGPEQLPRLRKFDLIISDIHMPGIDGIDTLKLIRRLCPDQACILITGYDTEGRNSEIEEIAPVAVLHKPLTNDELVAAIDSACCAATPAS